MARYSILMGLGVAILAGMLLLPGPAEAAHDQGYICYTCHSLNPGEIRQGSNSIRLDQPVLATIPPASTPWAGGRPISCDFCHRSASDTPTQNFATKAYKHPVDLVQTGDLNPVNEITCNDCHNGNNGGTATPDLTSATLLTKTATDGYPDHDNVVSGYVHNLTSNPPHLTVPYWGSTLPGANRTNDTTFWTNVRNNTQDMICWVCHETGRTNSPTSAPFTNVTSSKPVKSDYTGVGTAKGHQIQTNAGGSQLGVGAALPCYDCHDSHGSVNRALVLDNQSIYGSGTGAVAVTTFNQGSRPYNDKIMCAQCHDTGNTVTASTKSVPAQAGKIVEGMYPVDPYNSLASASTHISAGIADNMANSTKNCLGANGGCHASPHNPVGESTGGQNCSVCHAGIYQTMDAGSSTGYHHVMLSDAAPSGANYPVNGQPAGTAGDRTCTICHVDHNYFSKLVNPANLRARNLRADATQQPDNAAADRTPRQTDFDNTQSKGGVCTSCHQNTQTKRNPGTDIKNDGTTTTPVVSLSYFNGSAHNYPSTSPYIQSHFGSDNTDANSYYRANCTKCHNDTLGVSFQDNTTGFQFALHASDGSSAVNKLLAPLGYSPLTDNLSENFCYRCHSHQADAIPGTRKKTVDGSDWYNNRSMTQVSENVWGVFNGGTTVSRHPVSPTWQKGGTAVVDCLNCHNVHLTKSGTGSIAANPDNTYGFDNYVLTDNTQSGKQNRARYCLRCHDGSPPAYVVSATQYVPLTVRADNASMNQALWGGLPDNASNRGHWNVYGQFLSTSIQTCDACHDKHGSTLPKLIEPTINGQAVTGNNNTVCQACHTAAGSGYPAQEAQRTAGDNGYFNPAPVAGVTTTTRWPGFTVWGNATYSPHGSTAKTFGGFDGISRNVSDCRSCHDVHGAANQYNQLKATHRAGNYGLCFGCHGNAGGPAGTDNIARYFPTVSGGAAADCAVTTNVGHNVRTSGGYLPQYAGLPCYDCHMTHGSANGNTQLKSDQRWSGVGNTKYGATPSDNAADNASRVFCLGCHVASNDSATTGTVENLSRQGGKLKIPATPAGSATWLPEHSSSDAQGCHRCHYGRTYNDNTYGPHYPATGLCDACHESQGARSASAATYNGAHRTHTDNAGYGFACKQCHSWTATVSRATHKNDNAATQHAQVAFDNQSTSGWSTIQYATPFAYEYRSLYANPYGGTAPVPGYASAADNAIVDGKQSTVRWTDGTCSNVWCHSNANPVVAVQGALGVSNAYQSPAWRDNSLAANCTGCHGGDASSGRRIGDNTAPTNGSIAHLKHVNGGMGCSKCHYNTVKTANNRQIDNLAGHVNASKEIVFDPGIGGTWDNAAKTCSGTSCHGTPAPLPEWDNLVTVTGCGVCHQSNGPGNTFTFTAPHQTHTDNATYKTSCEVCHANFASGAGPNAAHADGDNSVGNPRTVQVAFTDCAANQTYNARVYYSSNLKFNPHLNAAAAPSYTENAAFVPGDNDAINASVSWSRGTCSNVWCHSNANPVGGANAYRTPQWTGALSCTPCHRGKADNVSMVGTDNLSKVHIQHVATNWYNFTCDECHAWTVSNDSDNAIAGATGYDNHLNGIKTVRFGSTLRTTNINQSGAAFENVAKTCGTNLYCHSNGMDNAAFQAPRDNTVRWDNSVAVNCATCHGGTAASGFPIVTQAHDNHVNNAATIGQTYACNRCHNATVGADNVTILSYPLHVNGYKNVSFPTPADNGTYANATKTCSNTFCHRQGEKGLGAADNLSIAWDCTVDTSCKTCHGSRTGAGYHVSFRGEPNYDNNVPAGVRNSHDKHVSASDNTFVCQKCHPTVSPTTLNVLASDNWARHLNDNVDVKSGNGASFTWTQSTSTCTDISCHGGAGTSARWGDSLMCSACHLGTGDVDDFGTGTAASFNNVITARIDNAEWLYSGHGKASGTYDRSGHPAAAFGGTNPCLYCHDTAISHDNTSNPYRLKVQTGVTGYSADSWNATCLICHSKSSPVPPGYNYPGGPGVKNSTDNGTRVESAHYGAKHGGANDNGGKFCFDCHDPHGDRISTGGNIFMVGKRVSRSTDNVLGIPIGGNDNTRRPTVTFTDNATGSNYADNTTRQGICQVCHTTGAVSHWTNSAPWSDGHNAATKCTQCHAHDSGFAGAGSCTGCHAQSYPPNVPDNSLGQFSLTRAHVTSVKESDCKVCHHSSQLMDKSAPNIIRLRGADNGAAILYTQDNSAGMRAVVNAFCLSCHDANGASYTADGFVTTPLRPFSDCSVIINISQYWQNTTSNSHNYPRGTGANNTLPVVVKSRSPHGFPTTNRLKQEAWTTPLNQTKYTDAAPVSCLECHPAHGSSVASPTKLKGAAFADGFVGGKMIDSAEPGLCWSCHDAATVTVKDYWGDSNTAGAHWTGNRKTNIAGTGSIFPYKERAYQSIHQVNDNAGGVVCSVCHNPHGASVGGQYYSPMLRGSWMTSPYLEDRAGWLSSTTKTTVANLSKLTQSRFGPRGSSDNAYNYPKGRGNGFDNGTGTGQDGYFIDENTFGTTGTMTATWLATLITANHITETDNTFGGLCATCHTDATWTGTGGVTAMKTYLTVGMTPAKGMTGWGSAIHNVVKGWAASGTTKDWVNPTNNPDMRGYSQAGTQSCMAYVTGCSTGWAPWRGYNWVGIPSTTNQMATAATAVHQFPCSKCHTPHASELPRLMTTNCNDVGASTTQRKAHGTSPAWNYPTIGGPAIGASNQAVAMLCHNRGRTNTATDNGWNKVTGW